MEMTSQDSRFQTVLLSVTMPTLSGVLRGYFTHYLSLAAHGNVKGVLLVLHTKPMLRQD